MLRFDPIRSRLKVADSVLTKRAAAPSEEAHLFVIHSTCGKSTSSADTCTECGERLTAANTSWHSRARSERPIGLSTAAPRKGAAA